MDYDELYQLTLEVLRERCERLKRLKPSEPLNPQDLSSGIITQDVALKAYQRNMWTASAPPHDESAMHVAARFLQERPDDGKTVRGILWRLVGLEILIPERVRDETNQFFDLSTYGIQVLQEQRPSPYDPFGFMKGLRRDAPHLDAKTYDFVQEAIDCFLGRHLRAAAVMLGLASENEILGLIDLYGLKLQSDNPKGFNQKVNSRRSIKEKFDFLYQRLKQDKETLPPEVRELETWLSGTFQVIRLHRNDAGHLSGFLPTAELVHANLVQFLTWARYLSKLKEQLKEHLSTRAGQQPGD